MDTGSSGLIIAPTAGADISQEAFRVVNWIFFSLCVIAFAVRAYIRYVCFRRLLFEDYLMLVALALHSAEAVLIHLYIPYTYDLEAVEKGDLSKYTPDFLPNAKKSFVAIGTSVNLTIVGVLIVKLNFLLFFRRLGANLPKFTILWWGVVAFTVAGAVVQIAMQLFGCFFGGITYIFSANCTDSAALSRIVANAIFSAVVDAVSDVLIFGFPVAILWKSRIGMRKKLGLTVIFSLVFFTIAITVVRGSVFHQVYSADAYHQGQIQSGSFTWFWFYCEYTVAFVIACVVSFRSLFVRQATKSNKLVEERMRREAVRQSAIRRGWQARLRQLQDSILQTCKTLEGWSDSDAEMHSLPHIPSGLMTVDFDDDRKWTKYSPGTTATSHERPVSARSLVQAPGE